MRLTVAAKTPATRGTDEVSSNPWKPARTIGTDPSAIQSIESIFPGYVSHVR